MTNLTTLYRKDVHHQNDATNTKRVANKTGKKPKVGAKGPTTENESG